jgi:hypothetical protein
LCLDSIICTYYWYDLKDNQQTTVLMPLNLD